MSQPLHRCLPLLLPIFVLAFVAAPASLRAQEPPPAGTFQGPAPQDKGDEREELLSQYASGDYTIGLYADRAGLSRTISLSTEDESFDCFLGVTADPVRHLSGTALRLEFPEFLTPAGPVRWTPIEGLVEREKIFENGAQILFLNCETQPADGPLILARVPVRVDPAFREGTLEIKRHKNYGLSVQLCNQDGHWPKREAEALSLQVKRKISLWDRIAGWFD